MPVYHCELCQFTTPLKSNYTAHTSSQKHIRSVQLFDLRQPTVVPETPQNQPVDNPPTPPAEKVAVAEFICKHCEQKFAFKQSMYRHMKNTCKKKEDLKETIRNMKVEIEGLRTKLNMELQKQIERVDEQQEQIEELMLMDFHTHNQVSVEQLKNKVLEQINHVFNRF
jgi:hypothetical protein